MNQLTFILAAYAIAACLVAALCIGTWIRARRVRQQLDGQTRL